MTNYLIALALITMAAGVQAQEDATPVIDSESYYEDTNNQGIDDAYEPETHAYYADEGTEEGGDEYVEEESYQAPSPAEQCEIYGFYLDADDNAHECNPDQNQELASP